MAPPPNSGDATNMNDDDPLGGMDPMKWLESLAARQGANPDELTTSADLDIAVPVNPVIDEPGYTPGYDTGKPKQPAAEPPKPPTPEPVMAAPTPEPTPAASDDPLGGMDPMKWLESLAARQGANPDELTTSADLDIAVPVNPVIDEPGYTPGYDTGKPKQPAAEPPKPPAPEPVMAAPTPEPTPAASDDPLGGMDPMKWLESLAARQGANPDELTTSADLDIAVPVNPVIDEPGYTPGYDTGKPKQPAAEPPKPPTPEPVMAAPTPEPAPASMDDPLGGMDPMKWLESLAARQGANPDELTTAADLDIPVPTDAVIDEPGYVDYDPFGAGRAAAVSEPAPEPALPAEPEPVAQTSGDDLLGSVDPLAWLESLAAKQGADPAELVTSPQSQARPPAQEPMVAPQGEPAPAMSEAEAAELLGVGEPAVSPELESDPLQWLSDLAAMPTDAVDFFAETASGEAFTAMSESTEEAMAPESALSWLEQLASEQGAAAFMPDMSESAEPAPADAGALSNDINEVQAWLFRQAENLEQNRQALEAEEFGSDEVPAAQASDLPDWLQGMAPSATTNTIISQDIVTPSLPADVTPWFDEPMPNEAELLASFESSFTGIEEPAPAQAPVEEMHMTPDEVAALTQPQSPDEVDSWAEALDEEYERRVAGDESVPDWYMEALQRAETEPAAPPPPRPAPAPTPAPAAEPEPAEAVPGGFDWLSNITETETAEPAQGEIPDWLREVSPGAPTSAAASLPSPQEAEIADLPDWLRPAAAPEPTPAPAQPAPAPTPAPQPTMRVEREPAPVPTPAAAPTPPPAPRPAAPRPPAPTVAMQPATAEHRDRLQKAREMASAGQHMPSLEHYQALIDASTLLEEVRGDLRQLADKNPKEPKVRRLLGDTYMRLGDLQAALETYRSALNQL